MWYLFGLWHIKTGIRRRKNKYPKPRAKELYESRGGRPGRPDHNKTDGFCGRKAAFKEEDPRPFA